MISKIKCGFLFSVLTTVHIVSASQSVFSYPFATFVMDAYSGQELHSQNANSRLHPASLTKMMTLYLVFNEVENGKLDLDEKVSVSRNAVREPPSKFGYRVGQKVSVRYLIRAAAIRSANDAATALGEAVSGTEAEFGKYMTRTARAMGMNQTSFRNANGLTASGHLSSARDMAILSRRLLFDFPEYFHLFGRSSVVSLERKLYNTNRKFLASYRGSDGIKTGYMTTIHSYTGDQPSLDTMHNDLYRARASSLSMIPTSTGAAKAVSLVLPELEGKLDGSAIRVPTPNVSCIDFKFLTEEPASIKSINKAIELASEGVLKGVLDFEDRPLVSIDFNHSAASSVFASQQTKVLKSGLCRVLSWYDNEWGFSNRMADTAVEIGKLM